VNEPDRAQGTPDPARQDPAATVDEPSGSVTRWIGELKAGDTEALQPLWERYFATLVERTGAKLRALRGRPTVNDEEDVALSAFHSLYQGIRDGRFPRLDDRDDLWKLLIHLTACKAVDHHRVEIRQKRGGGKVINEADMIAAGTGADDQGRPLEEVIGSEPSPEFAAMVSEEYVRRLDELGDDTLRRIAELKLACYSNEEIRQQLGCSLRSVTLKLELIRKKWQAHQSRS
jgi:DNA-directed RNA polymerase specialized sigma24 family protein